MEIADAVRFWRVAGEGLIKSRIGESMVQLAQHLAENSREVRDLSGTDITEVGHVAARHDVGRKRSWRGKRFQCDEVFCRQHDALFFHELFIDHLAEHAFAELVIVLKRYLKAPAYLAGNHRSGN